MMTKKHTVKNVSTQKKVEFRRQELKYLISNNLVDILIPQLLSHLEPDAYSKDGFYPISTVYFDTIDWQAFYSKLDGNLHRKKFRIRSYYDNPKPNENVFLEIKEKNNATVLKRRTPITMHQVSELLAGHPHTEPNDVYEEWRYNLLRNALKPKLLNYYQRLAFASDLYPGLRVTLDRDISYCMTSSLSFDLPTRPSLWSASKTVMEIKFDQYVPRFVVSLLRRHNLTQEPVSKYCDSVISNYLLI